MVNPKSISYNHSNPSLTKLTGNYFVVAWQDYSTNFNEYRIFYQIYSSLSTKYGGQLMLDSFGFDNFSPFVSKFNIDSFIITWHGNTSSNGIEVFAMKISNLGVQSIPFYATSAGFRTGDQKNSIAAVSEDSIVICWESDDVGNSKDGIYFNKYNSNGVSSLTQVKISSSGIRMNPYIIIIATGEYVIGWEGYDLEGQNRLYLQKLSRNAYEPSDTKLYSPSLLNGMKQQGGYFICSENRNAGCYPGIRWYHSSYSSIYPLTWIACPSSGGSCSNSTYSIYDHLMYELTLIGMITCDPVLKSCSDSLFTLSLDKNVECDPVLMNCSNSAYHLTNSRNIECYPSLKNCSDFAYKLAFSANLECDPVDKNCSDPVQTLCQTSNIECDPLMRNCTNSSFTAIPKEYVYCDPQNGLCNQGFYKLGIKSNDSTSKEFLTSLLTGALESPQIDAGITSVVFFTGYNITIIPLFWIILLIVRCLARKQLHLDITGMWYRSKTGRCLRLTSEYYDIFYAICFVFWIFYPMMIVQDQEDLKSTYKKYSYSIFYGAFEIICFKLLPIKLDPKLKSKFKKMQGVSISMIYMLVCYIPGLLILSGFSCLFSNPSTTYTYELQANLVYIATSFIFSPIADSLNGFLLKSVPIIIQTKGQKGIVEILGDKDKKRYFMNYERILERLSEYKTILAEQKKSMKIITQWLSVNSQFELEYLNSFAWESDLIDHMLQNASKKPKKGILFISIIREITTIEDLKLRVRSIKRDSTEKFIKANTVLNLE